MSALRPRVNPLMDQCRGRVRFYAECASLLEDALYCIEHEKDAADRVVDEINWAAGGGG